MGVKQPTASQFKDSMGIAWGGSDEIHFNLYGRDYIILKDTSRKRNQPSWYAQRMNDLRTTVRYYTWPDGAFSAVLWERCSWE